ncbi:MAG: hypothetical protein Fur006_16570 [Coleofasciculaceae cyanobacterium]
MQAIERSLQAIQQLILDAPVSIVTLLEDRALVRRVGKVNLTQGLWRIKVENVAPVLSDKSLRAEFCGNYPGARIDDVRVRREMRVLDEEKPEEIKALLEELRSLQNTFNYLTEDRNHQEYSFDQVNTILAHSLQELPVDAVWGQIDPKTWRDQLQTLFRQLRELRGEILNSYHNQEKLSQQIKDLITRIHTISRPDMVYTAYIEADFMISQAGDYEIAFDYVVPNAIWRPWHQARLLLEEKPTLTFRVDGCVWQRTGEDWNNVDTFVVNSRSWQSVLKIEAKTT